MSAESSPFLADPALLEALERISVPLQTDDNRVLFRQEEPCTGLFILRSGEAMLEMRTDQGEIVFSFRTKGGSIMGLPAVLADQPYSLTANVSKGSQVFFVNSADAINLFASTPAFALKALQVLAAETRAARVQIVSFAADK